MKPNEQRIRNEILQLINAYAHKNEYETTTEHLAAEVGYLTGWLASVIARDWTLENELRARLEQYNIVEASSEIMNKRKHRED